MEYSYQKPKKKVIKVFRKKELEELTKNALEKYFPNEKESIQSMNMEGFLSCLTSIKGGGEPVLIIEQNPLNSKEARGKCGEEVFAVIKKTGTQYSKKLVIPKNPRTAKQTTRRNLFSQANQAWKELSLEEKNRYNFLAQDTTKSGQNLFISEFTTTHQN